MERVREHVADGRVLALIERFLQQGVMEEMESTETLAGTPQGGVASPLLANIYLNPLDWLMEQAGLEMVRYADDMVVLCREPETAAQALGLIQQWMQEAGLELHPAKTRVVSMSGTRRYFDFLGYRFQRGKKGNLMRFIRPKSEKKLRERLKPLTSRSNGESLKAIVQKVNPIARGWYGYFKHASKWSMISMDRWIRSRLRSILRKRKNGKGRGRGSDHQRWRNSYFTKLGLFCLEAAQEAEKLSLHKGAKC